MLTFSTCQAIIDTYFVQKVAPDEMAINNFNVSSRRILRQADRL